MATESVSIIIKAFDQTQKALRSIQAAFGKLSKVFFNFKTALAGAVGAGGLGLLISQSLKSTDALAKTASKIGTTTEALSALQYAGQLTGVEVNTMNMALQRFTRRASEAAVGTGEAKGALRELNVDARSLVRLPLDERMLVLADAFAGVENESDRLRLAFKLFDSEGAALVNTLGQGRQGLSEMLGEARRLGVVMSSNAAKGVEDASDAVFRLQSLFGGIVKQVTAALAPVITALADTMTDKVAGAFDPKNNGIQEFAKGLAIDVVNGIIAAVGGLQSLTNGLIKTANEIIRTKDMLTSLFGGDQSAEQLQNAIDKIDERLTNLRKNNEGKMGPLAEYGKADINNLELQRKKLVELQEAAKKSGRIQLIDDVSFQDLIDKLETAIPKIKGVTDSVNDLADDTTEKIPTAFETFMANLQRTRELAGDLQPQLEKLADQAITGLGRSFTAAITGAQKFSDAIKSMAKSVIDSLIQMLIQKYIVDAAFGAISGAFSGGTTTSTGGGGGGSGLPAFANGGVATGGRPAIVGERGPELFIPSTTGRVVPNDQLGGGGVVVNQTINVTTGVQQTVRAEIANLLPQISNAAKSAVADARMRGGGFSKAMVGA
tara:strand:+ start:579 stop:2396 length:1818 start_codon:yes stop_codon:yes gene_type:complete